MRSQLVKGSEGAIGVLPLDYLGQIEVILGILGM